MGVWDLVLGTAVVAVLVVHLSPGLSGLLLLFAVLLLLLPVLLLFQGHLW